MSLPSTFVPGFHDEEEIAKMPYRPLGRSGGRLVSALSLGASSFGGVFHEANEADCATIVREALQAGVNVIDTAPWYGHGRSEEVLGRALRDIPREAYYLHTKVGRYNPDVEEMFDFRAETVTGSVHTSLERLGVDYIDTIQVHDVEFAPSLDIIVKETLPALEKLQQEGKVRSIGITGYPLATLLTLAASSTVPLELVLSYCRYSLHDTSLVDAGFINACSEMGLGVINASPLAMGLLTARGPPDWHPAPAPLKARAREAAAFCEEQGVDLGRLAMMFCLESEGPATTMVSTASVERNRANLLMATGQRPLSEKEREVMGEVRDRFFRPMGQAGVQWEGVEVDKYWARLGRRLQMRALYPTHMGE